MADQSDVETAVAALVAGFLYPNGTAAESAVGFGCRVYRGWPQRVALDADLAAGLAHLSVVAGASGQRTTTRYPDEWRMTRHRTPTLVATAAVGNVMFSGDAAVGQLAGVEVGGVAYVHRTVAGDTPTSVVAKLAAMLPGAGAVGAVLDLPGVLPLARVVADQTGSRETRRQLQAFRVVCWTATPGSRDVLASFVDGALSAVDFIGLTDGSAGRLRFVSSGLSDRARDAGVYRRDLLYSVDYATTLTTVLPSLLFHGTTLRAGGGVVRETVT